MKVKAKVEVEFEIKKIVIRVPVRYGEEDIPNDFPLRHGDVWQCTVDVDTGRILQWPSGKSGRLCMKVCDEGCYYPIAEGGTIVPPIENGYVPHGVIPGEYGDYIGLDIDADGVIVNWPKKPDFSAFFKQEE